MVQERLPCSPEDPSVLAEPLKFRCGKIAKNRFLKAALTERISTFDPVDLKKRGIPTERIINMYEKWGNGGFGMILTGNVTVDPRNLESAGNVIISKENDSEELRNQLKRYAKAAKSDGALVVMQLSHAGRQTPVTVYPTPFSASDVQLTTIRRFTGFGKPVALSLEQIQTEVIDRFVYAAKVAYETGFDGVQLHGAHGYLLSQFMSPTTNKRTDQYGGPPENRVRVVLEIFDSIRRILSLETGFIVGIKTNSVEFQAQGLQTEDAKIMCKLMEEKGFDFVEMSGGTIERLAFQHEKDSTRAREAFFLDFTDQIRPVFKDTVMYVTGGFRTVTGMVSAVKGGSTDGIGLGRPITAEPDLPKKILSGEALSAPAAKMNQDDYGITNAASNAQMALMGKSSLKELNGQVMGDIPDFSIQEETENFVKALADYTQYMKKVAENNQPIHGVLEYISLANQK